MSQTQTQTPGSNQVREEVVGDIRLVWKNNKLFIYAPYDKDFVEELKKRSKTRKWLFQERAWEVDPSEEGIVREIIEKIYKYEVYAKLDDYEFKLYTDKVEVPYTEELFKISKAVGATMYKDVSGLVAEVRGDSKSLRFIVDKVREFLSKAYSSPKIFVIFYNFSLSDGTSYIIDFGRDHELFKKSVLYKPLSRVRVRGSVEFIGVKRNPKFVGIVVIISRFPPSMIDSVSTDYVELEDTAENRVAVNELLEEFEKTKFSSIDEVVAKMSEIKSKLQALKQPKTEEVEEVVEEVSEEVGVSEGSKAVEELIKELEGVRKELELELISTPQPTTATPTATPTPPPSIPAKTELVKVYLLSMRLPSKYLLQEVEYNEKTEVRKWTGEKAEKASKLETIRRYAYSMISRIFCYVEEFGTWIAVTDEAVKEATKVSEYVVNELKKINIDSTDRYIVKAVPIYLEPDNAKSLLESAVKHLSADVLELQKRIEEAEKEGSKVSLKRLENEITYKKALLESFKKYLDTITTTSQL